MRAQAERTECGGDRQRDHPAADGSHRNRLLWARPDGELLHYDKRHLFRMAGEHEHYSPGERQVQFELKGWRIRPLICYDLRFPVWSRDAQDTDLLLYTANWPGARRHALEPLAAGAGHREPLLRGGGEPRRHRWQGLRLYRRQPGAGFPGREPAEHAGEADGVFQVACSGGVGGVSRAIPGLSRRGYIRIHLEFVFQPLHAVRRHDKPTLAPMPAPLRQALGSGWAICTSEQAIAKLEEQIKETEACKSSNSSSRRQPAPPTRKRADGDRSLGLLWVQ